MNCFWAYSVVSCYKSAMSCNFISLRDAWGYTIYEASLIRTRKQASRSLEQFIPMGMMNVCWKPHLFIVNKIKHHLSIFDIFFEPRLLQGLYCPILKQEIYIYLGHFKNYNDYKSLVDWWMLASGKEK